MVAIKIFAMVSSTEHLVYHRFFFVGTVMGARIRMGKGTTRKLQNKIIIIYLTEMKGEKLQSKLPALADLTHLDFGDIYWRERIQSPPLGLSLPLSPPFSHPPLLLAVGVLWRGERKESKNQHQQELLPTPAQPGLSSLIAHLLPSSFVI